MPAHKIPLMDRLWSKVNKNGVEAVYELGQCWEWTSSLTDKGYARFSTKENGKVKQYKAHILTWTEVNGPVPGGLELDHLCRTRHCVRPSHLEPVTHKVNMERGPAAKEFCSNGHPRTPENTGNNSKEGWKRCLVCHRDRERKRQQKEIQSVA